MDPSQPWVAELPSKLIAGCSHHEPPMTHELGTSSDQLPGFPLTHDSHSCSQVNHQPFLHNHQPSPLAPLRSCVDGTLLVELFLLDLRFRKRRRCRFQLRAGRFRKRRFQRRRFRFLFGFLLPVPWRVAIRNGEQITIIKA